jgi:hypothetical protein
MVPTVRFGPFDRLSRVLGKPGGVRLFAPNELADALADRGFTEIKPTGIGPAQWIDARLLASAA